MTNITTKIKVTSIVLLVSIFTQIFFTNYINNSLILIFMGIYFISLVYLNIQSFKIGGLIKKITMVLDMLILSIFAVDLIPITQETYVIGKLIPDFFLFISIIALLIAILVNTYKK